MGKGVVVVITTETRNFIRSIGSSGGGTSLQLGGGGGGGGGGGARYITWCRRQCLEAHSADQSV